MNIGIRVAEIMERNRRKAEDDPKITIGLHWYYDTEEIYKGKRYQACKMLIPSNWYRVRKYAREMISSLPHQDA